MIGSTGVLMRVAEDGVLADWFRKPHIKFGTATASSTWSASPDDHHHRQPRQCHHLARRMPSRHLVVHLQQPGHAVLRWKYHGERGWKVPPNIRIGKTEFPIDFSRLSGPAFVAIVNLSPSRLLRSAASCLPRLSSSSSASRTPEHAQACHHRAPDADHFNWSTGHISSESAAIRPAASCHHARRHQPLRAQVDPSRTSTKSRTWWSSACA